MTSSTSASHSSSVTYIDSKDFPHYLLTKQDSRSCIQDRTFVITRDTQTFIRPTTAEADEKIKEILEWAIQNCERVRKRRDLPPLEPEEIEFIEQTTGALFRQGSQGSILLGESLRDKKTKEEALDPASFIARTIDHLVQKHIAPLL